MWTLFKHMVRRLFREAIAEELAEMARGADEREELRKIMEGRHPFFLPAPSDNGSAKTKSAR
jgi:hypothetical protein